MSETTISVKEMMSKPAIIIDYSKSARAAALLMKKKRKGFLVVVKGGKPIGVLSDSDLINKVIVKKRDASKTKVEEIMASPLITVSPEADAVGAVEKMKKSNIHRLPVVGKGKVIGVLSLTDIARASPDMHHLLEYRQEMKRNPIEIRETTTSGICESCANYSERLTHVHDGRWLCESCEDELE
jgi:signal-transduction protein with cAMP-binding, CBS, and nucleotidyltransferase domain